MGVLPLWVARHEYFCMTPLKQCFSAISMAQNEFHLAVDDQLSIFGLHLPLVLAVGGVLLEHVDHVVEGDEGVVDSDHLGSFRKGRPEIRGFIFQN